MHCPSLYFLREGWGVCRRTGSCCPPPPFILSGFDSCLSTEHYRRIPGETSNKIHPRIVQYYWYVRATPTDRFMYESVTVGHIADTHAMPSLSFFLLFCYTLVLSTRLCILLFLSAILYRSISLSLGALQHVYIWLVQSLITGGDQARQSLLSPVLYNQSVQSNSRAAGYALPCHWSFSFFYSISSLERKKRTRLRR